jgi:hypothetical protein
MMSGWLEIQSITGEGIIRRSIKMLLWEGIIRRSIKMLLCLSSWLVSSASGMRRYTKFWLVSWMICRFRSLSCLLSVDASLPCFSLVVCG